DDRPARGRQLYGADHHGVVTGSRRRAGLPGPGLRATHDDDLDDHRHDGAPTTTSSTTTTTSTLPVCDCPATPFLAARDLRLNNDGDIRASVGVNEAGGRLRLGRAVTMPDGTAWPSEEQPRAPAGAGAGRLGAPRQRPPHLPGLPQPPPRRPGLGGAPGAGCPDAAYRLARLRAPADHLRDERRAGRAGTAAGP